MRAARRAVCAVAALVFELRWPHDVLAELGATLVRLRITLSYFIEPNLGRRGWKKRHRYRLARPALRNEGTGGDRGVPQAPQ
jgi:hypothetical protein